MGKASKRNRGGGAPRQPSGSFPAGAATDVNGNAAAPPRQLHPQAQRSANLGSTLIHFGIVWLVVGVLVKLGNDVRDRRLAEVANAAASTAAEETDSNGGGVGTAAAEAASAVEGAAAAPAVGATRTAAATVVDGFAIPTDLLGPMESYPDPLGITDEMRRGFHYVVKFPEVWVEVGAADGEGNAGTGDREKQRWRPPWDRRNREKVLDYIIVDHTQTTGASQLVPHDRAEEFARERRKAGFRGEYGVGRYDEDRASLYSSELFQDESHDIDGYQGARTIHMGIDLGGPVGTKVHAFADGLIHSAGYNSHLGDYGHVIVVEHVLPSVPPPSTDSGARINGDEEAAEPEAAQDHGPAGPSKPERKVYALYGHLDAKSTLAKSPGKKVRKGQVLGRIGDVYDNGGWSQPHVHFQLSTKAPETHDMPGAVSMADRPRALVDYPDPRIVLGPLY